MNGDGTNFAPDDSERRPPVRKGRLREWIRISRFQTARLWTIDRQGFVGPQIVSFHCPTCPEPKDSRLVEIELDAQDQARHDRSGYEPRLVKERLLLRVTREQVEQICDSFGRRDNGSVLVDICRAPDDSHRERATLPGSLPRHRNHEEKT